MLSTLVFSTIDVTRQAFYRTSLSYAIVNLRPIVPGHVLVAPVRPVTRFQDLNSDEITSLMTSVQKVGRVIERAYAADALSIVCQDGKAAGQTIPHVHFHILPRRFHDDPFAGKNDEIYSAVDSAERELAQGLQSESVGFRVDADEKPKERTLQEMVKEADWLKSFFETDAQ